LSKGLTDEFGPRGVRVTTVSPGPIRTAMWESADGFGGKLAEATGVSQADLRLLARSCGFGPLRST